MQIILVCYYHARDYKQRNSHSLLTHYYLTLSPKSRLPSFFLPCVLTKLVPSHQLIAQPTLKLQSSELQSIAQQLPGFKLNQNKILPRAPIVAFKYYPLRRFVKKPNKDSKFRTSAHSVKQAVSSTKTDTRQES